MKIDNRAGSEGLIAPLRALGVVVEEVVLPAGDVEIVVNGPEGRPVLMGVEYKTVEDAVACMRNGRFAEQLRGMRDSFEVSWLLVEGRTKGVGKGEYLSVWREGHRGRKAGWFEIPGKVTYQEFAAWKVTMAMRGGVLLWGTETKAESAAWLRGLEVWATAKDWEEHRAHLDFYRPADLGGNPWSGEPDLMTRVAVQFPGVGMGRAVAAAERFGSVAQMVNATQDMWMAVEGVGKVTAKKVVEAIHLDKRERKA